MQHYLDLSYITVFFLEPRSFMMNRVIKWVLSSLMLANVCYAGDDLGQINAQMQAQLKQQQQQIEQLQPGQSI